jgi:hypothetical protein
MGNIEMADCALPDYKDIGGIIIDCLEAMLPNVLPCVEREKIITNCMVSFSLLVCACEIIDQQGTDEKIIWMEFLRDIALSRRTLTHSRVLRAPHLSVPRPSGSHGIWTNQMLGNKFNIIE